MKKLFKSIKGLIKSLFIYVVIPIFLIWIYLYPYTRFQARRYFNKYISEQNINKEDIVSRQEFHSYPKDRYILTVKYKGQPGYKYNYSYGFDAPFKISLSIQKDKSYDKDRSDIKYPSLEK